ncbi:MAG: hypothetical protein HY748_13960 [Elusimicrobia bacterium]|nr:hypothetical protein [Elusimicrobiota bacterium]
MRLAGLKVRAAMRRMRWLLGLLALWLASATLAFGALKGMPWHDANPRVRIAARYALDSLAGVLEKLGADYVYSQSLSAFNEITRVLKV